MYRPLSRREHRDPVFDEPQEGLPGYLHQPVWDWVEAWFYFQGSTEATQRFRTVQTALRMQPPLDWFAGHASARSSLSVRFSEDQEFALDLVDLVLVLGGGRQADELNGLLGLGGSVWEATNDERNPGSGWKLTRRSTGPIREAISSIESSSDRAHRHLMESWRKISGRHPDASSAYREAVRAVEAAAKPVLLPNDSLFTLGKGIRAIRDKPEKWQFVLGPCEAVADMADQLWTSQLDRHGTDDETVPLNVSPQQADAAIHLAITLTRLFAGGLFTRA